MYLVPLKTAVVEALRDHFSVVYVNKDFANTWISVEYPREKANYPGIWINYQDSGELERAGIDHHEFVVDNDGTHLVTRWRFQGELSFTCAALTSLERDRLYDEMVRTIAFANIEGPNSSVFRDHLDSNDFIAMNGNFDVITPSGEAASPGTPWGTEEVIYEKTLTIDVLGEFVSDPTTNALALLNAVQTMGYVAGEPAPGFPDDPPTIPSAPAWNPNVWT